jgi:hypothetical protein
MPAPANPNRLPDIQKALKRAKPGDQIPLEALAVIYGTAKSRFVTVKNTMVGFPSPILQNGAHIFPAKQALQAMLDWEMRHHKDAASKAERINAILGKTKEGRADAKGAAAMPVRDLAVLSRMAAETEERERDQRLYIPAAEVERVASDVFSELSEFMGGLSNKVDPNGMLEPTIRAAIDDGSAKALLGFHARMKTLLNANAEPNRVGSATSRTRGTSPRRKRQ